MTFRSLLTSLLLLAHAFLAHATDIRGAGATFPSDVYKSWAAAYGQERGVRVSYQPTGSGDGIKRMVAREVDFGGTDSPMSPADLGKQRLLQFPIAVGGIVPVVHVRGLGPNQLRLSGELLADIMSGAVTHWNDKRIAELNPEHSLPAQTIVRVVRAERSGSTDAYTRYLSLMSASWKASVGHGQSVKWPGTPVAADGNDGIVKAIKAMPGAIGYVSYDRVLQHKLAGVKLVNRAGSTVSAGEDGFRWAVRASDLNTKGDETASLLDQPGPLSWPITVTTYVLVDAAPQSSDKARESLQFLYWAFMKGDALLRSTGFTPLPATVQARLVPRFQSIRPQDGKPLSFQAY
jgi:phosphate transport system substrate-binding protein